MNNTSTTRLQRPRRQSDLGSRLRSVALAIALLLALVISTASGSMPSATASPVHQDSPQAHQALFTPGPSFNVGEIIYPSSHDFDDSPGVDTCMSLNVPPGDTFTLSLEWEALVGDWTDAGDLDLYLYLDSACTESALLTSSFNSNAYTGELAEVTPQVRNISASPAVAGIRIGQRLGRGTPGQLLLQVQTGEATFLEHGTEGPPLEGQEGAPAFNFTGPLSVPENSAPGTVAGTITATDAENDPLTFFELEPAAGQASFQIDPTTGQITVEDPALLDREATETLVYWVGVTDGTAASLVGVGVDLTGVNDNPPIALSTTTITAPNTPVAITISGTDADIDPAQQLAMSVVGQPANGSVGVPTVQALTSSTVIYNPSPGFIGTDTFTFTADDGISTSQQATVTITITDDPTQLPTATPDTLAPTPTPDPGTPPPTVTGPSPGSPPPVILPPAPPPETSDPPESVVPPSAPRFVRAEARDSSALLTWQPPLSNGGAPVDGYRIFNINTARSTLVLGNSLEGFVAGLENGTSYLFQVRAFNVAGFGEGALVGPVIPQSGSPVPIDVRASAHPDDSITVWWTAPEGDRLEPVVQYRLWTEAGAPLGAVSPEDSLIVNVEDLQNDMQHAFRVTATDADGELIATGLSEPVYLPPTLASEYEPLPEDAILVELTQEARAGLQLALQEAAGGEGTVAGLPAILTLRGGDAQVFVHVDGLFRGLTLPPEFVVATEQLVIEGGEGIEPLIKIEIAPGVELTGAFDLAVDPSGIQFSISTAELRLAHPLVVNDSSAELVVTHSPVALAPGFLLEATTPEQPPEPVSEAVAAHALGEVMALVQITRSDIAVDDAQPEQIELRAAPSWLHSLPAESPDLVVLRVKPDGETAVVQLVCETVNGSNFAPEQVTCTADLPPTSDSAHYVITNATGLPTPSPTPQPTVLSAPTEPEPTATSGPALVVVKEPTATPVPLPQPTVVPLVTPTPPIPDLPGTGGGSGATIVTWLMSGILGLVVIRGAFYAVGRIRS